MLEKQTFEDLIEEAAQENNDARFLRNPREYYRKILNKGQYEFVERTGILRGRAPIIAKENKRIFNFPEDLIRPLRLEDKSGNEIKPTTSDQLSQNTGGGYRSRTETASPRWYYSDLSGKGKFELWPIPSEVFNKNPVEVTVGILQSRLNLSETIGAFEATDTKLYVLTANFLYTYRIVGENLLLERTINHAKSLSTYVMRVVKFRFVSGDSSDAAAVGTVFFANGADLIKVDLAGTVSTFGTATASIVHIFEFEFHSPQKIFYQITGDDVKRTSISSFSEAAVTWAATGEVYQSTGNFTNRNLYFSTGANTGVHKLDTNANSIGTPITANSVSGIGALSDPSSIIYFLDHTDSLIKSLDPSDDSITATTLTYSVAVTGAPKNPIASNYVDRFWYIDSETGEFSQTIFFVQEVDTGVKTRKAYKDINRGFHDFNIQRLAASNEVCIHMNLIDNLLVSSFDNGRVVNIDDTLFSQENGIILDIEDDTDVVNFSSGNGVIRTITVDPDVAYVNYVRCPRVDTIEIEQYWALIEYAKYRIKKKDGDVGSLTEAGVAWQEFLRYVNNEAGDVSSGHLPKNNGTIPVWY